MSNVNITYFPIKTSGESVQVKISWGLGCIYLCNLFTPSSFPSSIICPLSAVVKCLKTLLYSVDLNNVNNG